VSLEGNRFIAGERTDYLRTPAQADGVCQTGYRVELRGRQQIGTLIVLVVDRGAPYTAVMV